MRVLIVKALAADHLYSIASEALCTALEACGAEAETLAPGDNPDSLIQELLSQRHQAVISFGSIYSDLRSPDGRSAYDILGIKFLGWQFDHPLYINHARESAFGNRLSVYPNASHLRFLADAGIPGSATVLLAGAEAPATPPAAFEDRPWGIFVAATCNEDLARFWESMPHSPARSLVSQFVERLSGSSEVSVIDAFVQSRNALGLQGLEWDQSLRDLVRFAFTYVRQTDRVRAIEALVDSGLPLTLCGAGWKDRFRDRVNVQYIDAVPFADLAPLYGRAKDLLTVQGRKTANDEAAQRRYLHRGLAERDFERRFQLADYVVVTDAALNDGLLSVSLKRELPEALKPRRIAISTSAQPAQIEGDAQAA